MGTEDALQDAVPLTVGQEWSGYAHQLRDALARLRASEAGLFELAAGGTAVGTGLNAPPNFSREIAAEIARKAHDENLTLKEAALQPGDIDEQRFDEIVDAKKMVGHGVAGS